MVSIGKEIICEIIQQKFSYYNRLSIVLLLKTAFPNTMFEYKLDKLTIAFSVA